MKMTYTKSQFEMPDGKYLARFLGVTLREDKPGDKPRLGQDGKPLPPAMTWDFEIADGPEAGKKADKLTGRIPTPKSGCGRMLAAIADTALKDGVEVDLANYVGRLYRITIEDNRVSDNPPPAYVPSAGGVRAPHTGLGADGMPVTRWDYTDGQNSVSGATTEEVRAFLESSKVDRKSIRVRPVGGSAESVRTADQCPEFAAGSKPDPIPW